MTLRERFAKYTTAELEKRSKEMYEKLRESDERMHYFRKTRNAEFYQQEKEYNENLFLNLLDVDAVLATRR